MSSKLNPEVDGRSFLKCMQWAGALARPHSLVIVDSPVSDEGGKGV